MSDALLEPMDMPSAPRLGGIELGGTKAIAVLGEGTRIVDRKQFATTTPDETLAAVIAALCEWDAAAPLAAIGIASFGPVRVAPQADDYGTILATPKPGWEGAPVLARVKAALDRPVAIDTDVNGAALAEHRLGAARGCGNSVYITIGTGIGAGVLIDGLPVHGRLHPELGHVHVRRQPALGTADAAFAGVCPFHGDCIEGLISGPALKARLPAHPGDLAPDHPAWEPIAAELAELLGLVMLAYSPERILVGGGVTNRQPHLLSAARAKLPAILGGYLADIGAVSLADMVRPPALGDDAGPTGALVLAEMALARGVRVSATD